MWSFVIVGFGGAIRAICRYAISLIPVRSIFPFPTLTTNLLGAIIIGFVVGLSTSGAISKENTLFWKVGVCGWFTTFSTFSLEALNLIESGKYFAGGVYIVLSVLLCITGVALGRAICKAI